METKRSTAPSYVVGIGASAGGLEALERLFDVIEPETGMAFVVVQHLSPDFKSLMDELLARWTTMPIHRVEDRMEVEASSVYLIPPKKEMIISDGRLLLTDKDPAQSLTLPIDHFFRSLAQEMGDRSIAIILSGTGSDGSRGIEEVHNSGGLVICQSEETAKFDGMPRSARDTGLVDLTLPPEEIASALARYVANPNRTEVARALLKEAAVSDSDLEAVYRLLRDAYGIDFSHYKINTVSRRIERRLLLQKIDNLADYVDWLIDDPAELSSLYRDLLIGVTQFFRDGEAFDRVSDEIERLLERLPDGEEFRVWVAGCGTGEEAYSIAILIHEKAQKLGREINVKIFATDAHQDSLHFASHGTYSEDSLADVYEERRKTYFVEETDGFQVIPEIRQWVVFAPHNLIKDAPFTKIDLVTCRNMLIYLQPNAQKKSLSMFHFALKTGGVLFLGPSETLGELGDEFDAIDPHWKLFRKRRDVRLPTDLRLPLSSIEQRLPRPTGVTPAGLRSPDNGLMGIYDALLDDYMPAAILINESRQMLHLFGNAIEFLNYRTGRPTGDILDSMDPDLRTAVSAAIHRAMREREPIKFRGIPVTLKDDEKRQADIVVRPVKSSRDRSSALLITLEVTGEPAPEQIELDTSVDMANVSSQQVTQLETELRYARENLQATIEELETSNEELQATNEELVASNEELQSTNEELHSVNEELYTVNAEHQNKISELTELTRDMDNLLLSTDIHTIFLDRNLCIRKFTPKIAESFNFMTQDIGRRVDCFTHNIRHESLVEHIEQVLADETPLKFEVQDQNDNWFLLRILPYRSEKHVDGVVLTLTDVSTIKSANTALSESVRRRDEFLAMLSHELRNPLAAILNATYMLEKPEASQDDRETAYGVVRRQTQQMAILMNDLLDVARVTQGKIELRRSLIDLRDTIEPAVEAVEATFRERQQSFDWRSADEPVIVLANASRLQQIQVNLLTNASKYTPPGGKIELELSSDAEAALIRVKDNGEGIPESLQNQVFDLFVQSDATLDRSQGGMGVGLTLVKSLVELHGGTITVHSDGAGTGSEFLVRIPLAGEWAVPDEPSERSVTEQALGNKIVLVEDNADARKMLQSLLQMEGFEVHSAGNGRSGLDLIERSKPDLAIVDIGLPELDGYQVARSVKNNNHLGRLHMVALTGYGQQGDRQSSLDAGFDDHIVKPIDPQRLLTVIGKYVKA
ncbi:MAG: response regulator [Pirellulaceae bacterium]|nr:response regulator [Pirellulaceae bacterium]